MEKNGKIQKKMEKNGKKWIKLKNGRKNPS